MEEGAEPPLELEEFKNKIDNRKGYLLNLAKSVSCFSKELETARDQSKLEKKAIGKYLSKNKNATKVAQFTDQHILPDVSKTKETGEYPEHQRTRSAIIQDENLSLVKNWLQHPFVKPAVMSNDEYKKFVRKAQNFFVNDNGRLYRRNAEGAHKLVVEKDK